MQARADRGDDPLAEAEMKLDEIGRDQDWTRLDEIGRHDSVIDHWMRSDELG